MTWTFRHPDRGALVHIPGAGFVQFADGATATDDPRLAAALAAAYPHVHPDPDNPPLPDAPAEEAPAPQPKPAAKPKRRSSPSRTQAPRGGGR